MSEDESVTHWRRIHFMAQSGRRNQQACENKIAAARVCASSERGAGVRSMPTPNAYFIGRQCLTGYRQTDAAGDPSTNGAGDFESSGSSASEPGSESDSDSGGASKYSRKIARKEAERKEINKQVRSAEILVAKTKHYPSVKHAARSIKMTGAGRGMLFSSGQGSLFDDEDVDGSEESDADENANTDSTNALRRAAEEKQHIKRHELEAAKQFLRDRELAKSELEQKRRTALEGTHIANKVFHDKLAEFAVARYWSTIGTIGTEATWESIHTEQYGLAQISVSCSSRTLLRFAPCGLERWATWLDKAEKLKTKKKSRTTAPTTTLVAASSSSTAAAQAQPEPTTDRNNNNN